MDIVERFINYTKINTTTSRESGAEGIMPSSPGQMTLATQLGEELKAMGLEDVCLRDTSIVTATLPGNTEKTVPVVSFFGHLDTSAEQTADTHAQVLPYHGEDLCLNQELDIWLRESDFPELKNYVGDDLIVTDGTSLLGADDKAAVAAIMNAVQYLLAHPEVEHGPVKIGFVPDEEQGLRGAKAFDVSGFGADFGYTLDCCGTGEVVYENWNAGDAEIVFTGQSAHPMSAKGKLKNSLMMAHKFIAMLPGGEAPEYTEGREGYYWVKQLQGNSARTVLKLDIRDFTEEGYQSRMRFIRQLAEGMNALWGNNSVECRLADRYANVFNSLQGRSHYPVDIALRAYRKCGITPVPVAMRGGYDGAVLSQKGLPCPNLFTGAHNFHSVYEYLPVRSLRAASDVVVAVTEETFAWFAGGSQP
ncbi:TPA: peptidase T [Klebsiella oxytoca]|uniref:Peptidase T n=1 Tax=Klebsiella oxytoca TaxID=571 RepID=A0AAN5RG76_KLEOX|nr:peptidase T [Klebsiella oxytoca]